jgi:hypothetical protein
LEELQDDTYVLTTPDRELLLAHRVDPPPVDRDCSGSRAVDPRDKVQDRRLPAPRRADNRNQLATPISRSTPRSAG